MELKKLNEEEKAALRELMELKRENEKIAHELQAKSEEFNNRLTGLFGLEAGTKISWDDMIEALL